MSGQKRKGTPAKGAYILVIDLSEPLICNIKSLKNPQLPSGRYAYCGSAYGGGGIAARVARHLKSEGRRSHWHIDHLTAAGEVVDWLAIDGGIECDLVSEISSAYGGKTIVKGFGSTDCQICETHLLKVRRNFSLARWRK